MTRTLHLCDVWIGIDFPTVLLDGLLPFFDPRIIRVPRPSELGVRRRRHLNRGIRIRFHDQYDDANPLTLLELDCYSAQES